MGRVERQVKLENRKPIQVLRAIYYYLHFNEEGILDYDRFMKDGGIVANAGMPDIFAEKVQSNLVSIHKWSIPPISASICGIACAT